MLTDGPHGLRKQADDGDHLGLGESVPATCFPPAVGARRPPGTRSCAERVGAALGVEAPTEDVAVLLGPGINIKRSPLCGRNFEYFSEDPFARRRARRGAGRAASSAQGVGTSLKHFAANNQETDRHAGQRATSTSGPLREIYLPRVRARRRRRRSRGRSCAPTTASTASTPRRTRWLLTERAARRVGLRGPRRVRLGRGRRPGRRRRRRARPRDAVVGGGRRRASIVAAVRAGSLDEAVARQRGRRRVLDLVDRSRSPAPGRRRPFDVEAHHALAREAAGRGVVLLKNDGGIAAARSAAGATRSP